MSPATAIKDPYQWEPGSEVHAPFDKLFSEYYRLWDDPHSQDGSYLFILAPDVDFSFGRMAIKGRDGVQKMREQLIHPSNGPVVDCEHNVGQIYALDGHGGGGGDSAEDRTRREFLIKGTIWYELKGGRRVDTDWVVHMVMQRQQDDNWQATKSQIFLDTHEILAAVEQVKAAEGEGKR